MISGVRRFVEAGQFFGWPTSSRHAYGAAKLCGCLWKLKLTRGRQTIDDARSIVAWFRLWGSVGWQGSITFLRWWRGRLPSSQSHQLRPVCWIGRFSPLLPKPVKMILCEILCQKKLIWPLLISRNSVRPGWQFPVELSQVASLTGQTLAVLRTRWQSQGRKRRVLGWLDGAWYGGLLEPVFWYWVVVKFWYWVVVKLSNRIVNHRSMGTKQLPLLGGPGA